MLGVGKCVKVLGEMDCLITLARENIVWLTGFCLSTLLVLLHFWGINHELLWFLVVVFTLQINLLFKVDFNFLMVLRYCWTYLINDF